MKLKISVWTIVFLKPARPSFIFALRAGIAIAAMMTDSKMSFFTATRAFA